MTPYAAPLDDMDLVLREVAGLASLARLPGAEASAAEMARPILEEAARFAEGVLAPLNTIGDREGARLENGVVRTAPGYAEAYRRFVEAGWNAVPSPARFGGQNLPWALAFAVQEMWQSSCLAWGLCPILTQGAVDLLEAQGSPELQALYLPKLVSGEWAGAMVMTEPQAGSDLGAIKTRAVPAEDGTYRLSGQKLFITFGEHDMAENIVHLVLARTPDAPAGSRGISLFLVPKYLPDAEGRPGEANDLRCVSLEAKLGIHGSPTCLMAYGDGRGAVAWRIGEEHQGLPIMFQMMNNARLHVGLQGVGVAERALQQAEAYAGARVQGVPIGGKGGDPIAGHPDVARMLATMRSLTQAARALAYRAAAALDVSRRTEDESARAEAQATVDLLTPIVKAWCTETAVEVASLGIQVHGGMGYIEETGAAQHLRDARILPIYEGTNGIQANDLLFRKLVRDEGAAARAWLGHMRETAARLAASGHGTLRGIGGRLDRAAETAETATERLLALAKEDARAAAAGAMPYLTLLGTLSGGAMHALAAEALARTGDERPYARNRLASADFYARAVLPRVYGLAGPAVESA